VRFGRELTLPLSVAGAAAAFAVGLDVQVVARERVTVHALLPPKVKSWRARLRAGITQMPPPVHVRVQARLQVREAVVVGDPVSVQDELSRLDRVSWNGRGSTPDAPALSPRWQARSDSCAHADQPAPATPSRGGRSRFAAWGLVPVGASRLAAPSRTQGSSAATGRAPAFSPEVLHIPGSGVSPSGLPSPPSVVRTNSSRTNSAQESGHIFAFVSGSLGRG